MRSAITAHVAFFGIALAQTVSPDIAAINGDKFRSPYNGQSVTAVQGLVTAKGPNGFWIRSTTADEDSKTSESIYVYGSEALQKATVGDVVSLDGQVTDYRSDEAYLYLTEIEGPTNLTTLLTGQDVVPIIIGQEGVVPPTEQYTSLDNEDVFGVPNNQSLVSNANPTLDPTRYGLDFWKSLAGELVTIQQPRALSKPNQYGDTWVVGNWSTTGGNERGGLTITDGNTNPEAIVVGSPLDGSENPQSTRLGDQLEDITGIATYDFGFYRVLPLTSIETTSSKEPSLPPATNLRSSADCSGITIAQYNVENLYSGSANLDSIAEHIVTYLQAPDLMILQEIQDNNGPEDDGVVDANVTLTSLRDAINAVDTQINYSFADIAPANNEDGGQPGGNIRVAYLYNPSTLRLRNANPGSSTDATEVLPGPALTYNPGRIDPTNAAWQDSRKPLAAHWETLDGSNSSFFTINVHWASKGGSSSLHGDARPPVNGGVDERTAQANVTGTFIRSLLEQDPDANVIAAGDFNEFSFVQPLKTFAEISGLSNLDDVVGIPATEQYTYLYDMNSQELDHVYVSPRLDASRAEREIVHVNTWVSYEDAASDHDPSVARFNFCE